MSTTLHLSQPVQPLPSGGRAGLLPMVLAAAFAVLTLAACAPDDAEQTQLSAVRVTAFSPPNTPWRRSWEYFERQIQQRRADVPVEMYVAGELGSEETMLSSLRRQRVHIGGFSLNGAASVVPELNLLLAPYLFDSLEQMRFIVDCCLTEVYRELFARRGVVLLSWSEVGMSGLYGSKPITGPADVVGEPMRSSKARGVQEFLSALGADTVPLGYPDVLPGLETGLIRGGSSAPTPYDMLGLSGQAPYFTFTRHNVESGVILANKKWFESLPEGVGEALRDSLIPLPLIREDLDRTEREVIAKLTEQGVTFIEQDAEQMAEWKKRSAPALQNLIDQLPANNAQSLMAAIRKGKAGWERQRKTQ